MFPRNDANDSANACSVSVSVGAGEFANSASIAFETRGTSSGLFAIS